MRLCAQPYKGMTVVVPRNPEATAASEDAEVARRMRTLRRQKATLRVVAVRPPLGPATVHHKTVTGDTLCRMSWRVPKYEQDDLV